MKQKTLKQAYKDANMPSHMGDSVNDLFASLGVKSVKMGKTTLKVTKRKPETDK